MKALLVRVGADCTEAGGRWNGPVDSASGAFAYVPIPESEPVREELETPYTRWAPAVERLGSELPRPLLGRLAHADPDFGRLTYGDRRERGRQIRAKLRSGDLLVFYAGLRDVRQRHLVYALIGLFTIDVITAARDLPADRWAENAHTRRRGSARPTSSCTVERAPRAASSGASSSPRSVRARTASTRSSTRRGEGSE